MGCGSWGGAKDEPKGLDGAGREGARKPGRGLSCRSGLRVQVSGGQLETGLWAGDTG